MKQYIKHLALLFMAFLCCCSLLKAQDSQSYSLEQLKATALRNNHTLAIKEWQIKEKQAKIKEDEIRKYPSATVNGNYLYNFNLGEITIPAGTIGELQLSPTNTALLPNTDKTFEVGQHNNFTIGMLAYQPITQQAKIKTGLEIDKTDMAVTEKERFKISLQIKQAIDKLYYGTLITQKQLEEAEAKLALASSRLTDLENAQLAGKTTNADKAGLQAAVANEEQNILKLNIQLQDYMGDLINLTGINAQSLKLEVIEPEVQPIDQLEGYKSAASDSNADMQIAKLSKSKALLGIKAARQSNIPDFGLVGGYSYQYGNAILPSHIPFLGVNLKWNVQDVFSNKQVLKQRQFQLKQAEENIQYTQQQVDNDIAKAYRKISQSQALIAVAQKALFYQKEAFKLQEDKQAAGLNVKTDLLNAKSSLAKSEADMYAAQLSYLIAVSDLKILTGQ
ncbi:TolC family protein [Chitinophaga filiformis]|uniref:TolC family protein n=1 Tax=Chitinophaga filiformis TaxID=104663 RepID=UPI001F3AF4CB|nr:TolC family protein [Chitinophaga filiformis]MCF6405677.1 TolC family protein [Chitinophaga filiformis]